MPNTPPIAQRQSNNTITTVGQQQDPYQWLQEKENPDVIEYLEAENSYCQQIMQDTEQLQETLYQEILGRIRETDLSVPYRWQDYEYFSRTLQGQDYEQHWRRHYKDGSEQLLLDENLLAGDQAFFELGALEISPDQRLMAYCIDTCGDEIYQTRILDLNTGQHLDDRLDNCSGNLVWSMDSQGFHYSILNQQQRPYQIRTHRLGSHQSADTLLFEEADERFFVHAYRSKSDDFLLVESTSKISSEVWFADIATLDCGSLQCLTPRRANHEYHVDHNGHNFVIRSNASGINFSLLTCQPDSPEETSWITWLPHRQDVTIEDVELMANYLVVAERVNGQAKLRVLSSSHSNEQTRDDYLEFPDPCCSLDCVDNVELSSNRLRVRYESLTSPASIWDIDLTTDTRTLLKQIEVVGGYNPERFKSTRLQCRSHDGVKVPISLVGLKSSFEQPAPLLLYAYGAYGEALDPWFSHARLNLLERGFQFAIAHVRGGGCLGESWYHQGRQQHKKNSFDDFIACSQYLIEQGHTTANQLIISGGSAGGLLVGAVINQAPELYQAAIADVPFVDVLNSMQNPDLPLTQTEYDEWGNPSQPEVYRYIASYSPIENVKPQHYPHLLVTAGLEDTRVQYWEPAKWTAQMRHHKQDNNLLLLKTLMEAGHAGSSGRYDAIREIAFEQAFILKTLQRCS